MSRRTVLFLSAVAVLLARPAAAQDACSMEASVSAEPTYTVPADAPIFAPLRWGMTRDQARRALVADGWRRDASYTEPTAEWFRGTMFGHSALVAAKRNSAGRLVRTVLFVTDASTFTWDRELWREITGILRDGYVSPQIDRDAPAASYGSVYCSSFAVGGGGDVRVEWDTVMATVSESCQVMVFYDGPGWPQHIRAQQVAEARAADRQCRADIALERRDRDRLAPGTSARAPRRLPVDVPPPPPPPPQEPEIRDYSEVSPVLIGGIERLQQGIQYPDMEQCARIQGRVIVRFVVGPDGRTSNVEVVRSVSPGLDLAAVQAVQRARFEPGKQYGQPVSVRQTLPVTFRITENPPPAPYSPYQTPPR